MKSFIRKSRRKGAAIVTVLIVISLITILVVSFLSVSRIDHQSSTAFSDTQRAKLVAKGAVAHSIEILRNNIPDPAGIDQSAETATAMNWVVNPGRLTLIDENHDEEFIDLHTGEVKINPASTMDPDVHSVDLNEPIPGKIDAKGDAVPTITYALNAKGEADPKADRPTMRVRWVNLLKDPSKPASESNPIIARHAFWMDDESGKINFNTAMGKSDPATDSAFAKELQLKMMPPIFEGGVDSISSHYEIDEYGRPVPPRPRRYGLGNSRSVNLDVLLEKPEDLDKDKLMLQSMLRGYARYPEAVTDFIDFGSLEEKAQWWYQNRYNLTAYSRSPEFNAFGKPRLMTTFTSLSLEGGPMYQHPFIWGGAEDPTVDDRIKGVFHLSSLLGALRTSYRPVDIKNGKNGHTFDLDDLESPISARSFVRHSQVEMLMQYFNREFPGHSGTFVDKYGEAECAQMALNILAMAQLGTAPIKYKLTGSNFSAQMAEFLGKNNFFPNQNEGLLPGGGALLKPERNYWWYQPGIPGGFLENPPADLVSDPDLVVNEIPMLPIQHGPFITEIKATLRPEKIPKANDEEKTMRILSMTLDVEYYLPRGVGTLDLQQNFPFKFDFITIANNGEPLFELGKDAEERNWDHPSFNQLNIASGKINPATEKDPTANRKRVFRTSGKGRRKRQVKYYFTEDTKVLANDAANPKVKRFEALESVNFSMDFRAGVGLRLTYGVNGSRRSTTRNLKYFDNCPLQMIPLGVTSDDVLAAEMRLGMLSTASQYSISWQIDDPRLSSQKDAWVVETEEDPGAGTMGELNSAEPVESSSEKSKFRSIQRGYNTIDGRNLGRGDEMESNSRVSSKGFWSFIHTGVQSGQPWRTLSLNEDSSSKVPGLPDWLLMDLMGATQPIQQDQRKINATLPDEFSSVSYMHSTAGAINLNTKAYPDSNYFEAPARVKPLKAVFEHLRSDSDIDSLLSGIESHQDSDVFGYVGDLALVSGYDSGGTEWEREILLRNMINCLTTRSNTFGVWGVGQVVQKSRENEDWGVFEDGDLVRGEKRFFAIVERHIWPGKDGVPGNAHVNSSGELDRLAIQVADADRSLNDKSIRELLFQLPGSAPYKKGGKHRLHQDEEGTFPAFDGPQRVFMNEFESAALGNVVWNHSPLEDAYNPPQAVIKYRVVYFKYLDE